MRPQHCQPYGSFGRKRIEAERANFGRKSPYGELPKGITMKKKPPKDIISAKRAILAAILLRPKVSVAAAIRLGTCSRNTVAAVRPKPPFGRSLEYSDTYRP